MPFVLHKFAVIKNGYVVAFTDDPNVSLKQEPLPVPTPEPVFDPETGLELPTDPLPAPEPLPDLVLLPVAADPDPEIADDERLMGPNYEVLADKVRAYGTPVKLDTSKIPQLSFGQLLIGLVAEGWITEAEGNAWLDGTLPKPVTDLIATLPQPMQFPAKVRAKRPEVVLRTDNMVKLLGAAQNKSPAELDAFFAAAAAL